MIIFDYTEDFFAVMRQYVGLTGGYDGYDDDVEFAAITALKRDNLYTLKNLETLVAQWHAYRRIENGKH